MIPVLPAAGWRCHNVRMRAVILRSLGAPLVVEDVPDPVPGTGEVVVDVFAAPVLSYAGDVLSGKRQYVFTPPIIPGAGGVGRIAAISRDATELTVGDWVLCDPMMRARDNPIAPGAALQGLTAGDARGAALMQYLPDGTWAERVRLPIENAVRIGPAGSEIEPAQAPQWATIIACLVPYGGLDAIGLKAGEIIVINGATGAFGRAGVAVAIAMGAACVIATGRNRHALDRLSARFGARVRPVAMAGDTEADRARILDAAPGPIDCVLDLLPPVATPAQVHTAMTCVRPYGRVVLMGGLRSDLALPYAWLMRNCVTLRGQWMYPRDAVPRVVALVRAGLLSLDGHVTTFDLDHANDAVAHAAELKTTVICPRRAS